MPATKEAITSLTNNIWQLRILVAAIKLGIFDAVSKSRDPKKIAKQLGLHEESAARLLRVLVAMGFLQKKQSSFFNTKVASQFLVTSSPDYYGDFVLMAGEPNEAWENLDKVIKTGRHFRGGNMSRMAKEWFTKAMHNNAQAPAKFLAKLIDLKKYQHLLDIGGGSGAFSIILTKKFPNLKATVVDQAPVCSTAKKYIKDAGQGSKVKTLPGDYFKLKFPEHDVALFGQVMHSNSPDDNKKLLKKVYKKMAPRGKVFVTEFLLAEDRTGPLFPALFDINMLKQTPGGAAYTFSDIKSWLQAAGFKNITKKHLVGPHTVIMAAK